MSTKTRRVVFYIDSLKLGGAERVLLQWARWCEEAGWSTVVLTHRGPDQDAYPLPQGVERWQEAADPPWLAALGWWGFPLRVSRLRRQLRGGNVHLAVGVTTLPAVKLLLASRGLPMACVVSERNYPPAKPPAFPWRLLRRLSYPWADLHLVQTQRTGDWLRRHCGVRRQMLMPNPVVWPLPDLPPRLDPGAVLPDKALVMLAAGTKAHQKGFDRLVAVFRLLAGRWPDLHLVILGLPKTPYHGVDQQAWLRKLLADPQLQGRLLMPGRTGTMAAWYQRATLFTLPSRYEGFPNVLLEAMAAGCACVAADCPTGPAELIRSGENGVLLSASAEPKAWAASLEALLANPRQRQIMGASAREVRMSFDAASLGQRFLESMAELRTDG